MQSPPVPDEDRGPRFLACVTITTVAALITVTLRFHVRANIVNAVGWDDWIILIAMVTIYPGFDSVVSSTADVTFRSFPSSCWLPPGNKSPLATVGILIMLNSTSWSRSSSILWSRCLWSSPPAYLRSPYASSSCACWEKQL